MKKAVFIILDDTLITTLSGKKYALHGEDWKFYNQTVEAIRYYFARGYRICIISNQLQLMNNTLGQKTYDRKMELVLATLERDLRIPKNYINHYFSKDRDDAYSVLPNPGLIYDYALDFEIDVVNSIVIGSSVYDKEVQVNAGIKTYIDKSDLTM